MEAGNLFLDPRFIQCRWIKIKCKCHNIGSLRSRSFEKKVKCSSSCSNNEMEVASYASSELNVSEPYPHTQRWLYILIFCCFCLRGYEVGLAMASIFCRIYSHNNTMVARSSTGDQSILVFSCRNHVSRVLGGAFKPKSAVQLVPVSEGWSR